MFRFSFTKNRMWFNGEKKPFVLDMGKSVIHVKNYCSPSLCLSLEICMQQISFFFYISFFLFLSEIMKVFFDTVVVVARLLCHHFLCPHKHTQQQQDRMKCEFDLRIHTVWNERKGRTIHIQYNHHFMHFAQIFRSLCWLLFNSFFSGHKHAKSKIISVISYSYFLFLMVLITHTAIAQRNEQFQRLFWRQFLFLFVIIELL